jgi:hypothetical protein
MIGVPRSVTSILETAAFAQKGHAAIDGRLAVARELLASNSGTRIRDRSLFRAAATKENVHGRPREIFPAEEIVSTLWRQLGRRERRLQAAWRTQ